ncbi:TniQ family protein [Paraburkholderia mimosarum]|uniref:TniQ family protein n=1 Tax=Paraburkholderia mimosarum TaxID=312026 RepID=UPI00307BD934
MSSLDCHISSMSRETLSEAVVPWPVAPRPFFEEAFGSWLGRVAARYQISVRMLWESSIPNALPTLGTAGWILFPTLAEPTLERLSTLARLKDGCLKSIQTPVGWMTNRQRLPYCFRCLVLNDADVSAPRWKREWLEPTADYCQAHHTLLETIPASALRNAANFATALRAINRYRADCRYRYSIKAR